MQFEESRTGVTAPDFGALITSTSAPLLVPSTLALAQWEYSNSGGDGEALLVFVDFAAEQRESITEVIGFMPSQRESALVDLLMRATDGPADSPPRELSDAEGWLNNHLARRGRMRAELVKVGQLDVVVDGGPVEAKEFRAGDARYRVLCFDGERGSAVAVPIDREPPAFRRYRTE